MLSTKTIRTWYLVHKWTSLVSTVFLLLLCITGLPLIFHHEIEHLLGAPEPVEMPADAPRADLDHLVSAALAQQPPGHVMQYLTFDPEEPLMYATSGPVAGAKNEEMHFATLDARTSQLLQKGDATEMDFMTLMFRLHTDLFAGLPGLLFLGFMGLLFFASIISGVVVYGPFMRKLGFGTVRTQKSTRLKWLDLHNLLGIVTLVWASVVGITGVINTLALPILGVWQNDQLAQMVAPYKDKPPALHWSSVQKAVDTALQAAPDLKPSFVAYPGTLFTSKNHFAVVLSGNTPLSSRLLTPVLIDAETGALTDMRSMPWYVTSLLVSQPLHFGDYGKMPLKILWGLLDIVTIVVLGSGIYLWLGRRRSPIETRLDELERGGAPVMVGT